MSCQRQAYISTKTHCLQQNTPPPKNLNINFSQYYTPLVSGEQWFAECHLQLFQLFLYHYTQRSPQSQDTVWTEDPWSGLKALISSANHPVCSIFENGMKIKSKLIIKQDVIITPRCSTDPARRSYPKELSTAVEDKHWYDTQLSLHTYVCPQHMTGERTGEDCGLNRRRWVCEDTHRTYPISPYACSRNATLVPTHNSTCWRTDIDMTSVKQQTVRMSDKLVCHVVCSDVTSSNSIWFDNRNQLVYYTTFKTFGIMPLLTVQMIIQETLVIIH